MLPLRECTVSPGGLGIPTLGWGIVPLKRQRTVEEVTETPGRDDSCAAAGTVINIAPTGRVASCRR
jgi:hypothetical protein